MSEVSTRVEKPTISNITGADAQQKAAAARFNKLRDNPQPKRSLVEKWKEARTATKLLVGFVGTALILGSSLGIGYAVLEPIRQTIDQQLQKIGLESPGSPSTFNNSAETNYVKAGENGNAVPATPQEIKDFLASAPPAFVKPESGGQAPSIGVILSVPEDGSLKIVKTITDTGRDPNQPDYYYYSFEISEIYYSANEPFKLPLIEGAEKVNIKIATNGSRMAGMFIDYQLNDGRTVRAVLDFWDNNYTPTDIMKGIPTYVPSGNVPKDNLGPTKEFDLKQNPNVPLFSGTTHVSLRFPNEVALNPTYETGGDGKIKSNN